MKKRKVCFADYCIDLFFLKLTSFVVAAVVIGQTHDTTHLYNSHQSPATESSAGGSMQDALCDITKGNSSEGPVEACRMQDLLVAPRRPLSPETQLNKR